MKIKNWVPLGILLVCLVRVESRKKTSEVFAPGTISQIQKILQNDEGNEEDEKEKLCKDQCGENYQDQKINCTSHGSVILCDCPVHKIFYKEQCKIACKTTDDKPCLYDGMKCEKAADGENDDNFCECPDGTKLDEKSEKCKSPCTEDTDCESDGEKCNKAISFCQITCDPTDQNSCGNGMKCDEASQFCKCEGGTIGDKCENCPQNMKFHEESKNCRVTCDPTDQNSCGNGMKCDAASQFCQCEGGTIGDKCENCPQNMKFHEESKSCRVTCDPTDQNSCGNGMKCDEASQFCKCEGGTIGDKCENCPQNMKFHEESKKCRAICNDDKTCKNGMKCEGDEKTGKFCTCKGGTTGDDCGTCEDKNMKFDTKTVKCRVPCDPNNNNSCQYGMTCEKEGDNHFCYCPAGKQLDKEANECRVPCKDKCENGGTCKGGELKFCSCKNGTSGDDCAIVDDCSVEEFCGKKEDVNCSYDEELEKAICKCVNASNVFDNDGKECRWTCTEDKQCINGEICNKTTSLCKCRDGMGGKGCKEILGCKFLEKICKDTNAKCIFDENAVNKSTCECNSKKHKYDPKYQVCKEICEDDHICVKNATCSKDTHICECKDGYEGKECDIITGCKTLGEKCNKAKATCVHDKTEKTLLAKCNCSEEHLVYDPERVECVAKWCLNYPCGKDAEETSCEFDKVKNEGYCKCKNETRYFDYSTGHCTEPDKCVLRKEPCGKNRICVDGDCKCPAGFKEEGKECIPDMCKEGTCFKGANCTDTDGIVKCKCEPGLYYDGEKCLDGKCILGDYKKTCDFCPEKFKKDEKCEIKDEEKCSKDCGYGLCIKEGEKDICHCFPEVAGKKEENSTCVLKESVCASKKLSSDSTKCECNGKYKLANDKVTCELTTCADQSAQDECKKFGRQCFMDGLKFDCRCPDGYALDTENKICTDSCNVKEKKEECLKQGQFCFNANKRDMVPKINCKCPPPLSGDTCSELKQNVFLINNIPVQKKLYKMENGINDLLLNAHLIESMKATFQHFEHGYLDSYEDKGDTLKCSAWVQLQEKEGVNITEEVRKVLFQTSSFKCEDCDVGATLWPPSLRVTKNWNDVKTEELKFCSDAVKIKLCGEHSTCNETNNKCACPKGFRILDFTVKQTDTYRIQRCEDIDECKTGAHKCPSETTICVNTPGDYYCKCKPNYKKKGDSLLNREIKDKKECYDVCTPNPCAKETGTCVVVKNLFDCRCQPGYEGTFCDRRSPSLAAAKKQTVVVGAVLGTILGVVLIAFFVFYWRIRKHSYSEDFEQAPRQNHAAEMMERRPVRGMTNPAYE